MPPFFLGFDKPMAIFTTDDLNAVKAALVEAAVSGIASCTVAGQSVTARSVDELRRLLETIQTDLARSSGGCGLRVLQFNPPGCGGS